LKLLHAIKTEQNNKKFSYCRDSARHYAIQSHWGSPISVLIESSYATFC